ncbi:MAG TPA: vitamin K epoxide reductase family protein [Candidatus Paceibacterota bacterium]|nr:vitamin K epoxide reductase family protein [Candidatus Paceibacterota bacterium]
MLSITLGFVVAIIGFFVARSIAKSVRTNTPLVCPRRAPCEDVVMSPYGKFLGISNARIGQWYYGCTAILFLFVMDGISFPLQLPCMVLITTGGVLFSLYLVGVQAFALRKWCVWCLISTACALSIFVCVIIFVHRIFLR